MPQFKRKLTFLGLVMFFAVGASAQAQLNKASKSEPLAQRMSTPALLPAPQPPSSSYVLVPVSSITTPSSKAEDQNKKEESASVLSIIPAILAAIMWPLIVFAVVKQLLKAPQIEVIVNLLYKRTSQISIAGIDIKLSDGAEATIDDLKKLISKVPESHQLWVNNTHLIEQFRNVTSDMKSYLCTARPGLSHALVDEPEFNKLRFTLHVADIVFTHSVRQLVNYLGSDKGGAGRLFSARRGIIGLAWRLQKSQYQHRAFNDEELIQLWGMTRLEAGDTSSGKTLLLAFVLKDNHDVPIALLYVDGDVPQFFDVARIGQLTPDQIFSDLDKNVCAFAKTRGLRASLMALEEARVKVTQIDIYDL